MPPLSILIVGCGIAGPALATFLLLSDKPANEKPRITIVERSPSLRPTGQNIDVRGAGLTVIRKLGLEHAVRSSTTDEEGVLFVDKDNRVWATFAADKTGQIQTGTSDIEILRGRLADILYRRCQQVSEEVHKAGGAGVEYKFGETLTHIEQDDDQVHVRFAKSSKQESFDIVVGADGLQSTTRKLAFGVAGEETRVKNLGMYCGFFSMSTVKTDSLWRRWFHAPGRRSIMLRPGEHGHRTTAFVAVLNDHDERLRKAAADGRTAVELQKALLVEYIHDVGWEADRVSREMQQADDFYYDMLAQVKMERWSKGRVVLLGDSGYCASPISGMGTTLGLVGAYYLAGAILRHADNLPAAFNEYENEIRPLVNRAQRLAPGMPHLIHPETALGVYIMHCILAMIFWSKIGVLLAMVAGPPANAIPVKEYGFRQLSEWLDYN